MAGKACKLGHQVRCSDLQCQWEAGHVKQVVGEAQAHASMAAASACPDSGLAGRTAPPMTCRERRQLRRSHLQWHRGNDGEEAMSRTTTGSSAASAEDAMVAQPSMTNRDPFEVALCPVEQTGAAPSTFDIGTPKKDCKQRRADRRAHLQWKGPAAMTHTESVASTEAPASEGRPTASSSPAKMMPVEELPLHRSGLSPAMAMPIEERDIDFGDSISLLDFATASVFSTDTLDVSLTTCTGCDPRAAEASSSKKGLGVSFANADLFEEKITCTKGHVLEFELLPYVGGCDRCDCHLPRGTRVARCSSCMYDVCLRCQKEACLVVRNTFLSFGEPKELSGRHRTRTEPCELGCMCAEDSADDSTDDSTDMTDGITTDDSECSTDVGELDVAEHDVGELGASFPISCRKPGASAISFVSDHGFGDGDWEEPIEAQVVVRNTFLDVHMPREQRRRKTTPVSLTQIPVASEEELI